MIFPKLQFEISNWIFFQVWTGFSPVKFKFEKNLKIPVRIVKNVLSKWTKCRYCLVNAKNKNVPSEKISPQCVLLVSTVVQLFDQKEVVEMTIRFQSLFEFYYQGWVRKTSLNESNSLLQYWWLMLKINWSITSILKLPCESKKLSLRVGPPLDYWVKG